MYSALKKILGADYVGPLNHYLAWLIVFSVLQGVAMVMLVPVLNALFAKGSGAELEQSLLLLGLLVLLVCVAHYQHTMKGFALALTVLNTLHQRLGEHLVSLPSGWFSDQKIGRLSRTATGGTLMVTNVFVHFMAPVISGLVTPATIAVLMLFIDWRMGITALCCAPLIYLTHHWSARWIGQSEQVVDGAGVAASNCVVEFAQKQSLLRAFGVAREGYQPLEEAIDKQRQAGSSMLSQTLPRLLTGGMTIQLSFALLVVVGVVLAWQQQISMVELVALLALSARLTAPLAEAAGRSGLLRIAFNDLNRLAALFDEEPLPVPVSTQPLTQPGEVRFDQVRFGYEPHKPVLSAVSFHVPRHTMTAIVGRSGSGKTTLSRLLMRFFDAQEGGVYVGGVDVKQQTTEALMAQISVVMQDVYLFDDTLAANIRVGRPEASDEELAEAASLAGVDEILQGLPDGWLTRVGEGGCSLSGGERQRIAIARAILKNAPIMLLDEASAALDPENERYVRQTMEVMKQRTTLIVIAHNLPTIMLAEQILVLENGVIVEQGNHSQLLAQAGRYQAFWHERQQAKGWRLSAAPVTQLTSADNGGTYE